MRQRGSALGSVGELVWDYRFSCCYDTCDGYDVCDACAKKHLPWLLLSRLSFFISLARKTPYPRDCTE
eukprot:5566725-Ditylum_brightwellii.AAC.1